MRIRQLNHSIYQVAYHLVWGTKYRRKYIKPYVRGSLIRHVYKVLRRHPSWYVHSINTGPDHVHMLIEVPPTEALAAVVREIKTYTSIGLIKEYPFIRRIYPSGGIWSVGYFVSTVGLNEEQIRRYIDQQNQYDVGVDVTDVFS